MSEQDSPPELQTDAPVQKPPSIIRRTGCLLLLICWFTFILSPCLLITLAQQGEIVISQGNLPNQQIRVWLVMEIDQRGIGISSTSQHEVDNALCLQTDVRFLFWQGAAEPTSYCECYNRSENMSTPTLLSTQQGTCTP
ncbi:MAG: hypothetical protein U0694_11550 [Anaerolineae bacterium]